MPRTVMITSQECRKLIQAAPSRSAFLENLLEQLLDGTIVAQGKAIRSSAIDRLKGSPRQRVQDEPIPPEFWDLEVLSDPKSWISGDFSNPNSHDEWFGETVGRYDHVRFPANNMRPVLKPVVKLDPLAPSEKASVASPGRRQTARGIEWRAELVDAVYRGDVKPTDRQCDVYKLVSDRVAARGVTPISISTVQDLIDRSLELMRKES